MMANINIQRLAFFALSSLTLVNAWGVCTGGSLKCMTNDRSSCLQTGDYNSTTNTYFKCKWFDFGWLIGCIVAAFVLILILFVNRYMKASHRMSELEKRMKRNDDALLTPDERAEANTRDEERLAGLSAAERMAEYSSGMGCN